MATKGEKHWNAEERAKIILEAVTLGDRATCAKYSVIPRTLRRWRNELKSGKCPDVVASVREKRKALDDAWAAKVPGCLHACVQFLTDAACKAETSDPQAIHAVAGAMKLVAEVAMSWKTIDARISGQDRTAGAQDRQVPAGANVTPIRRTGS